MIRVCAIGDSHIAAMMLGWEQLRQEFPLVQITFFAAPGVKMRDLTVSHGLLVPGSAELHRHFAGMGSCPEIVGDYDCFLVSGLGFKFLRIRRIYEKYRGERHARDSRTPISDACYLRSLQSCLQETLAVETIRKLRQITSAPIGLIPQPLPSEQIARIEFFDRVKHNGEGDSLAELFAEAARQIARDLGIQLIPQPVSTRRDSFHTKAEYSRGSVRLKRGMGSGHPDDEFFHMNASYGSVILREAFADPVLARQPLARVS